MISETTFSTSYTSFWREFTPNSERFVRRLNLSLDRFALPIKGVAPPERRAFVNEVAYRLFVRRHREGQVVAPIVESYKKELFEEVRAYLIKFDRAEECDVADASDNEFKEVLQISDSIRMFVRQSTVSGAPIVVAPSFKGCGFLDSCAGDLLVADELVEVKAGDRAFRATDIRQLLTYCALNSVECNHAINKVGCVNPRRGVYFIVDLDTLSLEISSKSSVELLGDIAYFISSGDISR